MTINKSLMHLKQSAQNNKQWTIQIRNQKLAMKKSDFMNSVDKNKPKSDGFL